MPTAIVSGSFDDLRSRHIRFLEEASRFGSVQILLWPDEACGNPKYPLAERRYLLAAVRYVSGITVSGPLADSDGLPFIPGVRPDIWIVEEGAAGAATEAFCREHGLLLSAVSESALSGFPAPSPRPGSPGRKKVIVTGCYDWFHSGHVRFFEEVSRYGDLFVVVGSDANVKLLKGPGHPMFKQDERRYVVGSMRQVRECLISTGKGWMDAEPEIDRIRPDIYAVNRDGDNEEKRLFCRRHGLEYLVLERTPREGLPSRSSTVLRGF